MRLFIHKIVYLFKITKVKYAVISGDIVSSTSLAQDDKKLLERELTLMVGELTNIFGIYGRVIKGDYLECVVPNPAQALQVCLAIKSFVKGIDISISDYTLEKKRAKLFKEYGIRLAIGYGELDRFDAKKGVIDGEAIYLSGRMISGSSTHDKERIVVKNTLYFTSKETDLNKQWEAILALLDVLFAKATSRQSEVVYLKLLGNDEDTISKMLGIDQSVVNRHSTSVGWNAIENIIEYYNDIFSKR